MECIGLGFHLCLKEINEKFDFIEGDKTKEKVQLQCHSVGSFSYLYNMVDLLGNCVLNRVSTFVIFC